MNRFNRTLLAATVVGGLSGGVAWVQGGSVINPPAQQLDGHWKHPHMHTALASLHEARHELESSEDIFKGHRQEALDHVDRAIEQIHAGLKEQGDDEAATPADLPAPGKLEDYPHMHHALEAPAHRP